jgi:hypothetical protein
MVIDSGVLSMIHLYWIEPIEMRFWLNRRSSSMFPISEPVCAQTSIFVARGAFASTAIGSNDTGLVKELE